MKIFKKIKTNFLRFEHYLKPFFLNALALYLYYSTWVLAPMLTSVVFGFLVGYSVREIRYINSEDENA